MLELIICSMYQFNVRDVNKKGTLFCIFVLTVLWAAGNWLIIPQYVDETKAFVTTFSTIGHMEEPVCLR